MLNFAICLDSKGSGNNKLFDQSWADSHPGSGWLKHFKKMGIDNHFFNCVTGDVALQRIRLGKLSVKNTFIIDELGSKQAKNLLKLGCTPFMQTAFEAPLYAPLFYDRDNYENYLFITRYSPICSINKSILIQRFPSFYRSSLIATNQKKINRIVCVAANKYRTNDWDFSMVKNKNTLVKWLKHGFGQIISSTYSKSLQASLHNERLIVLSELAKDNFLDLYGVGWDNPQMVPKSQRLFFQEITKAWRGIAGCKHDLIKQYEFGLCIENMEKPGYVTEKIFDCLAAGVIPVYLGAPDIEDFVPSNAFVDLRRLLKKKTSVLQYLKGLPRSEREDMRVAGLNFLKSPAGDFYSYEGYAEWVYDLAMTIRPQIKINT